MKRILVKLKSLNLTNLLYPTLGVGLFLLIWFVASKVVGVEMILPTPFQSNKKLFELFGKEEFWLAVGSTLGRSLYAFTLAVLCAILFAIVGYLIPQFARVISPIIVILRSVPTMSITRGVLGLLPPLISRYL